MEENARERETVKQTTESEKDRQTDTDRQTLVLVTAPTTARVAPLAPAAPLDRISWPVGRVIVRNQHASVNSIWEKI